MMTKIVDRAAVIVAFSLIMIVAAFAQDARPDNAATGERFAQDRFSQERFAQERSQPRFQSDQRRDQRHQPGQFDFYLLALSWSPSFCESSRERNGGRSDLQQCTSARPYSFVVHGLWPQYERGFPRECQVPAPRLSRNIVDTMLDIMPAPRLVFNQWDRHGTCSGLDARKYFDTVRKARETVQIPAKFQDITSYLAVTPGDVEKAFIDANPGLSPEGISVTCDRRRLSEVRICMSKDLQFRSCPEVDRRSCRDDKVMMPPVRGG
ncbi:MAG: ribonuclease T2 family protein [Pseudorhodoplanes sp.]